MDLCHIEIVTSEKNVPLSELELSLVLEPTNPKDRYAVAVYHGNSKMGCATNRFRGLAKEEHDRGSHLVALDQWSRSIWRCVLTNLSAING